MAPESWGKIKRVVGAYSRPFCIFQIFSEALSHVPCIPFYLTCNRPTTDTPSQGWPTPWGTLPPIGLEMLDGLVAMAQRLGSV
jgi:hypothetical protein